MKNDIRPTLQECIDGLEFLARRNAPFVVRDWDGGSEGLIEAQTLARSQFGNGNGVGIIALPTEHLPQMSTFLAVATVQKEFLNGRSVLHHPVIRTNMSLHPRNRPVDSTLLAQFKTGLEISTFTLSAALTVVELSLNTKNRSIERKEGVERAQKKICAAVELLPEGAKVDELSRRFKGLLDRGRRKAASFFGIMLARDVAKSEAERVFKRLTDSGEAENAERDIVGHAKAFARAELRAVSHEAAMYRWNRNTEKGRPIDPADLIDIVGGTPGKASASDLLRVAVAGDVNPSDIYRNYENVRPTFDLGRRIGRLMRGGEIEIAKPDAVMLACALHTGWRCRSEGWLPETDADACNLYLADAMLEACAESAWWLALINRTLTSGVSERVSPADFPEI